MQCLPSLCVSGSSKEGMVRVWSSGQQRAAGPPKHLHQNTTPRTKHYIKETPATTQTLSVPTRDSTTTTSWPRVTKGRAGFLAQSRCMRQEVLNIQISRQGPITTSQIVSMAPTLKFQGHGFMPHITNGVWLSLPAYLMRMRIKSVCWPLNWT